MDYVISILGPLAEGSLVTLRLFFITLALAVPLGLALALARVSRFRTLSALVNGYIWLMRGTPLMLQLLFIYFALPFVPVVGIRLPDFPAAIVAFALNYAAYFAEIFRAGIQSIDRGQYEGAKALGFSYAQTMRRIPSPTEDRNHVRSDHPLVQSQLAGDETPLSGPAAGPGGRSVHRRASRKSATAHDVFSYKYER